MNDDTRLLVVETYLRDALYLFNSAGRYFSILDPQMVDWTERETKMAVILLRAAARAARHLTNLPKVPEKTRHNRAKRQVAESILNRSGMPTRTRRAALAPTADAPRARTARGRRTR